MNKTDLLQLPDTQEIFCTAKDLKDLVREVEEEYNKLNIEKTIQQINQGFFINADSLTEKEPNDRA